jgi:hypothetical protein
MRVDSKVTTVESFARQCHGRMIPLNKTFSYFSALPLEETALRKLLYEPIAAVPPRVGDTLPNLAFVLVPFLEKHKLTAAGEGGNRGQRRAGTTPGVTFDPPAATRRIYSATIGFKEQDFLFLAIKDEEVTDCHYSLYGALAALLSRRLEQASVSGFHDLVRDELAAEAHGEIDERSWRLKEQLIRRQRDPTRPTKLLENYCRQALEDTLTLYLHGLCCDIDIEAGPRQLASPRIRRRLELLRQVLPPPKGRALFPEDLSKQH